MTGGEFQQLVARAQELEAAAERASAEGRPSDALRQEAADLRVRALGERPYPVLICAHCQRLTGWVDGAGICERCAQAHELRQAWSAPHGEWVDLTDQRAGKTAARSGLGFALRSRKAREHAVMTSWLARVDPGTTGPITPETGFELEVAQRDEVEAPDRSSIVVRFRTTRQRFDGDSWARAGGTHVRHDDLWLPAEFPASIPIEQLAEAWADYTAAVESFNRRSWSAEDERRGAAGESDAERDEALRRQRHTSDLLPEE
jgi:hypothetical protein